MPGPFSIPQADFTALNGKAAIKAYLSVNYPKESIVECEALRYGYLNNRHLRRDRQVARQGSEDTINVLILGELVPSGTARTLHLLEQAASYISSHTTYVVKPHPVVPFDASDYPLLDLKIDTRPLEDILYDFDIAYSSNMTSAAVDAYLSGLPVVIMLNDDELNFSPLRGQKDVRFVTSPKELAEALEFSKHGVNARPNSNDFFFLDPVLSRWQNLLFSQTGQWERCNSHAT